MAREAAGRHVGRVGCAWGGGRCELVDMGDGGAEVVRRFRHGGGEVRVALTTAEIAVPDERVPVDHRYVRGRQLGPTELEGGPCPVLQPLLGRSPVEAPGWLDRRRASPKRLTGGVRLPLGGEKGGDSGSGDSGRGGRRGSSGGGNGDSGGDGSGGGSADLLRRLSRG